ncbi:MAG TPA: quinolinate synthase NadA [Thermoplasmatales archaeon]|nr:quinolinate synthase NadA [Thermoplasmatales archaeon]
MDYKDELIEEIRELKEKHNAVILSHVYQEGDIQDIADFVGDSLGLSRKAVETNADIIVFCGVLFMAETAYILNPDKKVLIPDPNAGCFLADTATLSKLKSKKREYPNAAVVSYVNSSAQIKAYSDVCCTSANAIQVVESIPNKEILFIPDRNLADYVAEHTDKKIIPWDGYCLVHENISIETIQRLKDMHPNAEIVVHPECKADARHIANYIGSTSAMARYISESPAKEFIVGTEDNFVYRVRRDNPDKIFYPVGTKCIGMRRITLEKLRDSLLEMKYEITIPENIRRKAKKALDKMLEVV